MLRIKIDLVPHGNEEQATQIGEMVIANIGFSNSGYTYAGWMEKDNHTNNPRQFGTVEKFDRNENVWYLIQNMINACLNEKHKPDKHIQHVHQRLKKKLLLNAKK